MSKALDKTYDGIIIGAGHHGLILGTYLARRVVAGAEVEGVAGEVLERAGGERLDAGDAGVEGGGEEF